MSFLLENVQIGMNAIQLLPFLRTALFAMIWTRREIKKNKVLLQENIFELPFISNFTIIQYRN